LLPFFFFFVEKATQEEGTNKRGEEEVVYKNVEICMYKRVPALGTTYY
jgi:hypothetical protein